MYGSLGKWLEILLHVYSTARLPARKNNIPTPCSTDFRRGGRAVAWYGHQSISGLVFHSVLFGSLGIWVSHSFYQSPVLPLILYSDFVPFLSPFPLCIFMYVLFRSFEGGWYEYIYACRVKYSWARIPRVSPRQAFLLCILTIHVAIWSWNSVKLFVRK